MNKDIRYNGLSTVPSDYEAPDGDLSVAINLIPENGALHPILPPAVLTPSLGSAAPRYIHRDNYILYDPSSFKILFLKKNSASSSPSQIATLIGVTHFNSIGNTLLAFTSSAIHYFLWKENSYINLGDHIPEIDISFGLVGRPRLFSISDESKSTFTISFDKIPADEINNEFSAANKTRITEQVMAKVNKFIREQTVDKGRFCFPFFVRYALRLFDGSLVYHSAPILMNPSTSAAPVVLWNHITGKSSYSDAELDIMMVAATLDCEILSTSETSELDKWSDIITGIEVFISKPIYTFDQSGECSSWMDTDNLSTKFIGRLHADNQFVNEPQNPSASDPIEEDKLVGAFNSRGFLNAYAEWYYSDIYRMFFSPARNYPGQTLHLPEFSDRKVAESLADTATFYKLHSFPLAEVRQMAAKTERTLITVDDDYLPSLLTREVMTDDYLSHDSLAAEHSYVYNNRLNLSGVARRPFRGFYPQSMFAFCTYEYECHPEGLRLQVNLIPQNNSQLSATVYINEGGRDYAVSATDYTPADRMAPFISKYEQKKSWGCYLFYPNVNARKMVISDGAAGSMVIDLKPHDFLNGAFALLDYESVRTPNRSAGDLPSISYNPDLGLANSHILQPSKIYTSEVNNPFFFPLLGINSVGSGNLLRLCSAAKALSEGQFGQFPLYAFTDEGVWALEVAPNGTYSARQPITRDVCINPDGITQLDSAVLFPTERGIMLISGSQTRCISESVNSPRPFFLSSLTSLSKIVSLLGHEPLSSARGDCAMPALSSSFLRNCRMVYDYTHARVIIYSPDAPVSLVYSLKSNQWGMLAADIKSSLNSYPDALAVDSSNRIINFSAPADLSDTPIVHSLLLTRPLKLDLPDALKTVDTVILRGRFRKGSVQTAIYGSRNLFNWHLIWSSKDHYLRGFRGSPYKYFRIAAISALSDDESIFGASVQFSPRLTNQPR